MMDIEMMEQASALAKKWHRKLRVGLEDVRQEILCLALENPELLNHPKKLKKAVSNKMNCGQITLGGTGGKGEDDVWHPDPRNPEAQVEVEEVDEELDARLAALDEVMGMSGSEMSQMFCYSDRQGRYDLEEMRPGLELEIILSASQQRGLDLAGVADLGKEILREVRPKTKEFKRFSRLLALLISTQGKTQSTRSQQTYLQLGLF